MTELAKQRHLCVEFLAAAFLVDHLPHGHLAAAVLYGASFYRWLQWARRTINGEE